MYVFFHNLQFYIYIYIKLINLGNELIQFTVHFRLRKMRQVYFDFRKIVVKGETNKGSCSFQLSNVLLYKKKPIRYTIINAAILEKYLDLSVSRIKGYLTVLSIPVNYSKRETLCIFSISIKIWSNAKVGDLSEELLDILSPFGIDIFNSAEYLKSTPISRHFNLKILGKRNFGQSSMRLCECHAFT